MWCLAGLTIACVVVSVQKVSRKTGTNVGARKISAGLHTWSSTTITATLIMVCIHIQNLESQYNFRLY